MNTMDRKWIAGLMAIAIVAVSSGCASSDGKPDVLTVVAGNQTVQTKLNLAGVLVPVQTASLSAKFSGQVTQIGSDVGKMVHAGDVLAVQDTDALNAQLKQAQAGLQTAQAGSELTKSSAVLAKVTLDSTQKTYDKTKALFEAGVDTQGQMDDATDKLTVAQKQYENALGPSQSQSQAAISTAKANILNLQVQIGNAVLKSPINGVVTNRSINRGEVASVGTTLFTIADTSQLKLKGTISQDMLPYVKMGQSIGVTADIYPDRIMQGTVTTVGPMAVSTSEVFPVEITVPNDGTILAGLSAHAALDVSGLKSIVIPASSVTEADGKAWVFVIQDGKAIKRIVLIGNRSQKGIEIVKGVQSGERIAVTGVSKLSDNLPVTSK